MRLDVLFTLSLIIVATAHDEQQAQSSLMRRAETGGPLATAPSKSIHTGSSTPSKSIHSGRAEISVGDDGQGRLLQKKNDGASFTETAQVSRQSSGNFGLNTEVRSLLDAAGVVSELTNSAGNEDTGFIGLSTTRPFTDSTVMTEVRLHAQQKSLEPGQELHGRHTGYHPGLMAQITGGTLVAPDNLEALEQDHVSVIKARVFSRFYSTRMLLTIVAAVALTCLAVTRRDVLWQCFLWLRYQCGVDRFRAFEATIVIWEATYREQGELATCVRVTIGGNSVFTEASRQGRFYRSFRLQVPQRTSEILVELCDEKERPLASVSFDPLSDILEPGGLHERLCKMNVKGLITDPNVRLTLSPTGVESLGAETEAVAYSRLEEKKRARGGSAAKKKEAARLEALAASCAGTLRRALPSGTCADCLVNVARTAKNGWVLRIWDAKGERPLEEIALCHVKEVKAEGDILSLEYERNEKAATVLRFEGAAGTLVEALEVLRKEDTLKEGCG